jgi:hypothetical protein
MFYHFGEEVSQIISGIEIKSNILFDSIYNHFPVALIVHFLHKLFHNLFKPSICYCFAMCSKGYQSLITLTHYFYFDALWRFIAIPT